MDPIPIVIVIVSTVLTLVVVAISVQVWFILKEIRLSLQKMNMMLDDMTKLSRGFSESVSNVSGIVNGIKAGLAVVTKLKGKESDHE